MTREDMLPTAAAPLPSEAVPTETELLRQQLLRAQRLSSVGTLASSVAHEFNNILTTILNYSKIGLKPTTKEDARIQAFDKIHKASQRAAVVVNSMLGFARNQTNLRKVADLVSLVEDVLVLCDKDLAKHQVHIEKRFHGRPKVPVVRGQIEQILLNLIINARQAMSGGGRLTLDVRETADMAEVHICDTGVGIPPENLRLIFDPFFTTKDPDSDGQGGSGLGLSVCRQIIEQHHGRIRVESVIGKGSRFTVKLPRQLPTPP
jgi:signal transduction histidine kinase